MLVFIQFSILSLATLLGVAIAHPKSRLDRRFFEQRNGINYTVFEHAATGTNMSFVKNSGICETTAGVNQYSGYLSVGDNMNMWFWYVVCPLPLVFTKLITTRFFEARNNASSAPLATWFNGGPGCASMSTAAIG